MNTRGFILFTLILNFLAVFFCTLSLVHQQEWTWISTVNLILGILNLIFFFGNIIRLKYMP